MFYIMSLFDCVDWINEALEKNPNHPQRCFMYNLKKLIEEDLKNNNYGNLMRYINDININIENEGYKDSHPCLKRVSEEISKIQQQTNRIFNQNKSATQRNPSKFDEFKIADFSIMNAQDGTSGGHCLGLTYAMVDKEISPYEKHETNPIQMTLGSQIRDYQNNQTNRTKDQQKIKRTRLTRLHFEPNPKQLAKKLINIAKKNINNHLMISLISSTERHACYLSYTNGEIRWADQNRGAYRLKMKKNLLTFT